MTKFKSRTKNFERTVQALTITLHTLRLICVILMLIESLVNLAFRKTCEHLRLIQIDQRIFYAKPPYPVSDLLSVITATISSVSWFVFEYAIWPDLKYQQMHQDALIGLLDAIGGFLVFLRLCIYWKLPLRAIQIITFVAPVLKSLLILLVVFLYIFAIVGFELFQHYTLSPDMVEPDQSTQGYGCQIGFISFNCSLFAIFQILTTNNWNDYINTAIYPKDNTDRPGWAAPIFLITSFIFFNWILVNLMTAIIIESYKTAVNAFKEEEEERKRISLLQNMNYLDKGGTRNRRMTSEIHPSISTHLTLGAVPPSSRKYSVTTNEIKRRKSIAFKLNSVPSDLEANNVPGSPNARRVSSVYYKNNPAFDEGYQENEMFEENSKPSKLRFQEVAPSEISKKILVVAAVPYTKKSASELSFNAGERLVIDESVEGDWYFGHLESSPEQKGRFPSANVISMGGIDSKNDSRVGLARSRVAISTRSKPAGPLRPSVQFTEQKQKTTSSINNGTRPTHQNLNRLSTIESNSGGGRDSGRVGSAGKRKSNNKFFVSKISTSGMQMRDLQCVQKCGPTTSILSFLRFLK